MDVDSCALPPCHAFAQFVVDDDRGLTTLLTQRSGDLALGVPFNIASYAFLTHMLAKTCGLTARRLIHTINDAHVYEKHFEGVRTLIDRQRSAGRSPSFAWTDDCTPASVDEFTVDHVRLTDYRPILPNVTFELNVG